MCIDNFRGDCYNMGNKMTLKINPFRTFLYIIIILNLNCFYFVDSSAIPLADICLVVEAAFLIYVFTVCNKKVKYNYAVFILCAVVLAVTSSIAAENNYRGQPFMLGFRPQRAWLGALMMYFPITKLLKGGKLTKYDLIKIVDNICVVYGFIILIQFVLGGNNIFMKAASGDRYDSLRLYISTTFLELSFFYHLYRIVKGEKVTKKDILLIAFPLLALIGITKSRMRIISFLATSIMVLFSYRFNKRKMTVLFVAIISLCIFSNTRTGEDILNMAFGEVSAEEDTSVIREVGREFYIKENTENWDKFVFGSGYVNIDWLPAAEMSGINENIGYNDNGIFGLFFLYGFSFVIWTVVFNYILIRDGFKYGNAYLSFYLIFKLLGCFSLFPGNYISDITFAVLCAIVGADCIDGKNYENKNTV